MKELRKQSEISTTSKTSSKDEIKKEKDDQPIGIRKKIAHFMGKTNFHATIIFLVMCDLVIVMVELFINQYIYINKCSGLPSTPTTESLEIFERVLGYISFSILSLFVVEVLIRIWAIGFIKFFTTWFHVIDFLVVIGSFVLHIIFEYANHKIGGITSDYSKAVIILRMLRMIRMLHAVAHGIEMRAHKKITRILDSKLKIENEMVDLKENIETLILQLEEHRFRLHERTKL